MLAACLLLSWAPAAPAQEDGVTVDPDSPSGQEYAIPLQDAREKAGARSKRPRGKRPAPSAPFGEGIAAPPASQPDATATATPQNSSRCRICTRPDP